MKLVIRRFEYCDYREAHAAMAAFTDVRGPETPDEIWFMQHPPVYTLGLAGKSEHLLDTRDIPVIQSDRGGQVTYHGPGQLLVYLLVDLRRQGLTVKTLVQAIEQSVIDMLEGLDIEAQRQSGAPGVYAGGRKIAALGIRVRRACSFHGLALNIDMDLTPFQGINPCGYPGLEVTQIRDFNHTLTVAEAVERLQPMLLRHLGFTEPEIINTSGTSAYLRRQAAA